MRKHLEQKVQPVYEELLASKVEYISDITSVSGNVGWLGKFCQDGAKRESAENAVQFTSINGQNRQISPRMRMKMI